jgi:hypothetical protein
MGCVVHFFIRSDGITRAEQLYKYLGEQFRERFGIDGTTHPEDSPTIYLRNWFAQAADALGGDPLVVVIDALDECDEVVGDNRPGNTLSLPRDLPARVYVILARRNLDPTLNNVRLETEPNVANPPPYDLMAFPAENRNDVKRYLRSYFEEHPHHPWLARHKKTVQEAVHLLAARSEANFMYLRYVLPHLEQNPEEFDPETLPEGLRQYYFGHWRRMTAAWRDKPESEYIFEAIYLLAVAEKPLTAAQIAEMLPGVKPSFVPTIVGQWREFLDLDRRAEPAYRIYHASFADFLAEQDAVAEAGRLRQKASQRLKNWFLNRLRRGGGNHD